MKKLLLTIPLAIFVLAPFWAHAQDYDYDDDDAIENTFGIGPHLGYYHVDDFDDGTLYYGIQARARLGPAFGLEGTISYRPGTETSFAVPDGPSQSFETKFVPITGSLMIFLPLNPGISPYGLAGAGAYYTIYDTEGDFVDDIDSEFNFGYHLGFGVELPFSENVALSLDYRYIFLTPDNGDTPEDADYSGNVFTGGLMFYF